MPKKYTKKRTKRHSKTCYRNRNKSYSKKRLYGGSNSNRNKNRNERGVTANSNRNKNRNERGVTANSIDNNPVVSKDGVVMALSSGFVGTGQDYINHKRYKNFQGEDY